MSEWQKVNLGDCCEITSSKRIFFSEYVESGIPFYRSKEIIEKGKGEEISHPLYISKEKYDEIKGKYGVPQKGDLLLTAVGSLGIPFVVKDDSPFYFKDGNLVWLKHFQDIDPIFLYYWIKSENGYNALYNIAIGSAQKALTIAAIKGYEIPLPPLQTQHRIANILSRYDSLIENYQKQIKLLEEAAQRLYKEWFVDLRFPGHENTNIVDGVPEGWEKKSIGEIGEYLNGFAFKPSDWQDLGKPIIKIKEMGNGVTNETPRNSGERVPAKYLIKAGDLLFSWSATLMVIIWSGEEGWLNQHLFKVTPVKGIDREFLLQRISNAIVEFQNLTTGSTMKHIQRNKLDQVFVNVPNAEIMKRYSDISEKTRSNILSIQSQLRLLTEARDRLLPKLMSGEITV